MKEIFSIFIVSMLPVSELRGAIPIGILIYKMPVWKVFLIAVIGNFLPVPFVLLFLKKLYELTKHLKIARKFFNFIFNHAHKRKKVVELYEELGLMLFVGIPLPVTGAWTAAVIATLLNLDFKKSLIFIFLGIIIAGIIVTFLVKLGLISAPAMKSFLTLRV